MKKFSFTASILGILLLASCGGTKGTTAAAPGTAQEFDPVSGSWKPLQKVAVPAPHEQGAVIVEKKKPGMMDKIGSTVKKPLKWVGLAKDDEKPSAAAPAKKSDDKPAQ